MTLTPMRYKNYIWPHNPRVYTIDYSREMAVNKVPFGLYQLQDLDRTCRVMKGEGEFVGDKAYAQFGQLANVFYDGGPGLLVHPLWQTAKAYFVQLRLEQQPRPDYVKYSFTFWEDACLYLTQPKRVDTAATAAGTAGTEGTDSTAPRYHRVVKGDTLWALARTYGVELGTLIALNPQIKNPNLIRVGDEVRVQ